MKKLLLILFAAIWAQDAAAQVYIQKGSNKSIRMYIGNTYSKQVIIGKFGEPKDYNSFYDDEIHNATVERYAFQGLRLSCAGNELYDFGISSIEYVVGAEYINTVLKIGDSITPLLNLPAQKAKIDRLTNKLKIYFYLSPDFLWQDSLIVEYDSAGNITYICWNVPE